MVARGRGVLPVPLAHRKEGPRSQPRRATIKVAQ
jgi:hypothetical protein